MNITVLAKKIISWYYDGFNGRGKKYVEKALLIMASDVGIDRIQVKREELIEKDSLFSDINNVIMLLSQLREDGYTSIEQKWSGYEYNYFVATKMSDETNEEYYQRLAKEVEPYIEKLVKEEDNKKAKIERIKQLENELRQLKNT